jgi:hypothetical protein
MITSEIIRSVHIRSKHWFLKWAVILMIPLNIYTNIDQSLAVAAFNLIFNIILIYVFWFGIGLNEMNLSLDKAKLTLKNGSQSRKILINDIDVNRSYFRNGELRLYKISNPHHDPIQIYPSSIKDNELKQSVINLILARA